MTIKGDQKCQKKQEREEWKSRGRRREERNTRDSQAQRKRHIFSPNPHKEEINQVQKEKFLFIILTGLRAGGRRSSTVTGRAWSLGHS